MEVFHPGVITEFMTCSRCSLPTQNIREEKQSYEKELMNLRNRYEEETSHFRETQSRALEELSKKHRAALENTQSSSEKEKNRLLAVSALFILYTHTHKHVYTYAHTVCPHAC